MISIKNVSKTFGSKKVIKDLSLEIPSGKIFGFLGPNGAGKTTTINMIVGMLLPNSGSITVNGLDVVKNSFETKKIISYVPDTPEIYEFMTGFQYLQFLSDIYELDKDEQRERVQKYASLFEMSDVLGNKIASYSHGMKQKICLIGALINEPEVFILDEPMVGLDPKSSYNLKELMRERTNNGKTVFFSTHVMEVAEKICDELAIIKGGEIIAKGSMEEIRERAKDEGSLEKIFLELTE